MNGRRFWGFAVGMWALWVTACGAAVRQLPADAYPETKAPPREASDTPVPVKILSQSTTYRIDEQGRYERTVRQRYEILTQAGVSDWGETAVRWSPWYMDRPELKATVTSPTGEQTEIDAATLSDTAAYPDAPDLYSDARLLRAPLPNVRVGSVVDEVTVVRTNRPFFGGATMHYTLMASGVPVEQAELVVELPAGTPFRHEVRGVKVEVDDQTAGGRRRVRFSGGPYAALQPNEPMVPTDVASWPYVAFTTGEAWRPLAQTYGALVEERLKGVGFDEIVASVVVASDPPLVKANKLLTWVRKRVRYVGIEFGESAIVPHAPSKTLERGYGDCKDQATLLVGLLRAAGLPARVALLRAGFDEDVRRDLPALNVFNHAIVVVVGDDPIWIDPTVPHARAGELPVTDEDRLALVVDEASEHLTRTPGSSGERNSYREHRTVRLPLLGKARIVERSSATGYLERYFRGAMNGSAEQITRSLEGYVVNAYNTKVLSSHRISDVNDLDTPFSLTLEAAEAGVALSNLRTADAIVNADPIYQWVPSPLYEGEERKTELVLGSPYEAEVAHEIHGPEGFVPDDLPELGDLELGPARLERSVTAKGAVVHVRHRLRLTTRRWAPADVMAFRAAYIKLRGEAAPRVRFVHAGLSHQRAGRLQEALAAYRKPIAAEPGNGIHHMRLATALVELGFGTTARATARAAVALAPTDATLHAHLGDILASDLFGRLLHTGYDRPGALAAFRDAARLDPDDMYSRSQIGVLLEHNDAGERYGEGSDLSASVAHFDGLDQEALAAYGDGTFVNNALFTLMWEGRFDEVQRRLQAMKRKDRPAMVAISVAAALGGPGAGLSEALAFNLAPESQVDTLTAAAGMLIKFRKYAEAAALTEVAASHSGDTKLRVQARTQAKLRRVDVAALPTSTASEVATKAYALYASSAEVTDAQARELISPRAYGSDGRATAAMVLEEVGRVGQRVELTRAAFADALVTVSTLHEEGDPAIGFRVRVNSEFSTAKEQQVFVAPDKGGLRVLAFSGFPSELGCEALHQLGRRQRKAAEQWLAWGADLVPKGSGGDPLFTQPFVRIREHDPADVELAAAALCAQGVLAARAIPTLEALRGKAKGDRLVWIDHALMDAYENTDRMTDVVAVARRLEASVPASRVPRFAAWSALGKLDRHDEVRREVKAQLAAKPDDPVLLSTLAWTLSRLGRLTEAVQVRAKVIGQGRPSASMLNEQAWLALFVGPPSDEHIGLALRAVSTEEGRKDYALHTLACLYADLGRTEQARQTLFKLLELRAGGQAEPDDWYIVGRVAEDLSLPDEARAAYARVERRPGGSPTSTWDLAQRRLAALK